MERKQGQDIDCSALKRQRGGLADGNWCHLGPEEAIGDGWAETIRKKRYLQICRHRFDSVVTGKVKNTR